MDVALDRVGIDVQLGEALAKIRRHQQGTNLDAVNTQDYRAWLKAHGAGEATIDSAPARALIDQLVASGGITSGFAWSMTGILVAAGIFALVYVASGVLSLALFALIDTSRILQRRFPVVVLIFAGSALAAAAASEYLRMSRRWVVMGAFFVQCKGGLGP